MYQKEIDIKTTKYCLCLKSSGKPIIKALLIVPIWLAKLQENEKQQIRALTVETELELYDEDYNFLSVTVLIDEDMNIINVYNDYGNYTEVYTESGLLDSFFCNIQNSLILEK